MSPLQNHAASAADPERGSAFVRGLPRSLRELRAALVEPRIDDALSRTQLVDLYRKRAASYDVATQLYRLAGFRLERYRSMAVDALELSPGATVIEIGCGTGANFALLQERVGPSGRIIGVDLTDAMLEQARERVRRAGWPNVELIQCDAGSYRFPEQVDGILSMLALTHCADYDAVIQRGAEALTTNGRWVVADLKQPDHWPDWLVKLGLLSMKPYGVTLGAGARHPWESLARHLPHSRMRELYFGIVYLAVGWKG